jgi:hypothetical protein
MIDDECLESPKRALHVFKSVSMKLLLLVGKRNIEHRSKI